MAAGVDGWSVPCQAHVELVKLFAILSARHGSLGEAGRKIVGLVGSDDEETVQRHIDPASEFFEFVASLDRLVNDRPGTRRRTLGPVVAEDDDDAASASAEADETRKNETKAPLKNVCTFVETGEGFTEQHWYNCYTCGLIWDKVCLFRLHVRLILPPRKFDAQPNPSTRPRFRKPGLLLPLRPRLPRRARHRVLEEELLLLRLRRGGGHGGRGESDRVQVPLAGAG